MCIRDRHYMIQFWSRSTVLNICATMCLIDNDMVEKLQKFNPMCETIRRTLKSMSTVTVLQGDGPHPLL